MPITSLQSIMTFIRSAVQPLFIQGNTHQNGSGGSTTVAVTLASPVGAGHLICVSVGNVGTAGLDAVTGITDDKGNTYTLVRRTADGVVNYSWQSAYFLNATNAPQTITATFGQAVSFATIVVDEYASANAFDVETGQSQTAPGTGTDAITSGSVTTTAFGLVYGAVVSVDSVGLVAGTGFTQNQNVSSTFATEGRNNNAGATAATFTSPGGTGHFISYVMAFKV